MERLTRTDTKYNGYTHEEAMLSEMDLGECMTRLAEYEDTGLTPGELYGMTDTIHSLVKRNDKQYKELQKAIKERDYWEREAKKWGAKLGEIRFLVGRQNG